MSAAMLVSSSLGCVIWGVLLPPRVLMPWFPLASSPDMSFLRALGMGGRAGDFRQGAGRGLRGVQRDKGRHGGGGHECGGAPLGAERWALKLSWEVAL